MKKFFWPQGIAVVGASADPAKPGGKVVQLLQEYGYPGRILPINPGRREIQGLPAFTSLAEINTAADLVVIAVEASATLEIVRQCAALELKNIVVISAGFAEIGAPGEALQNELAALIEEHALNVLGPNCIGFINSLQPAAASFSLTVDSGSLRIGPAAFVAQSGGLGILAIFLADLERMGCSYMISTGNEVDLDFAEVINFLAHEPRVKVIGG
ncbi:MAG: CoA-binding protein, partial [Firmicutes bacterium]|nr:CoA-binding protein [Bacillota bacterium]